MSSVLYTPNINCVSQLPTELSNCFIKQLIGPVCWKLYPTESEEQYIKKLNESILYGYIFNSLSNKEISAIRKFVSKLPKNSFFMLIDEFEDDKLFNLTNVLLSIWFEHQSHLDMLLELVKKFPPRNHVVMLTDFPNTFFNQFYIKWMKKNIHGNYISFPNLSLRMLYASTTHVIYAFQHEYEAEMFFHQIHYGSWHCIPNSKYQHYTKLPYVDTAISLSSHITFNYDNQHEKINTWLNENVQSVWSSMFKFDRYTKLFSNSNDALLFKLTWAEFI